MTKRSAVLGLVILGACAPKRVNEQPILRQGERVEGAESTIEAVRMDGRRSGAEATARRDSLTAAALASCGVAVCDAIAEGVVALGMMAQQVLAATRTTEGAWQFREAGNALVMVPASIQATPRDAVGALAMVRLRDGRVAGYSYHEPQGLRLVSEPADATTEGRANALAEMLLREGDDLTARGELNEALDRYDRAQVLRPSDPIIEYRIATVLDKQLRPIEALVRYQLFLHRLELEKIQARGQAYGYLADAIARARERVIVLEKQSR
jgi:tetratricopeptide (TPR) repeat protein